MKPLSLCFLLLSLVPQNGICQSWEIFTDIRDGQEYRTRIINGTKWMLDNLNFETELSLKVDSTSDVTPIGRFYHMYEIDSVCPQGWTVSRKEDWLTYFDYLIKNASDSALEIQEDKQDEMVHVHYWGSLDPFNDVNPLEMRHTGWIEGGVWSTEVIVPPPSANYWVLEPSRDEIQRTHAHISMIGAQVHRHKHHTKPSQERKLRRFMVRCVESE